MSGLSALADRYIQKSTGVKTLVYKNGNVDQIIDVILDADEKGRSFTARFSKHLRGNSDMATLKNVWQFVKTNIKYVRDKTGDEVIKSPGAIWETKKGDCKSFSVFIGSILNNLGYEYKYRVAFYDPKTPEQGHIYPVAILDSGKEVIVDAVWDYFNDEVPYWKAYDYNPRTRKRVAVNGLIDANNKSSKLVLYAVIAGLAWLALKKKKRK